MSRSKDKGTAAEREVVKYLKDYWPAAERRALSGNKDKGDVAGIPGVVVEVKAAERQQLAAWKRETLAEMGNAEADLCLLVVKRKYKPVAEWDTYTPCDQLAGFTEEEAGEWVRMDLRFAAMILQHTLSSPFSPITGSS